METEVKEKNDVTRITSQANNRFGVKSENSGRQQPKPLSRASTHLTVDKPDPERVVIVLLLLVLSSFG